jgi:serine/threonine-protein kinase
VRAKESGSGNVVVSSVPTAGLDPTGPTADGSGNVRLPAPWSAPSGYPPPQPLGPSGHPPPALGGSVPPNRAPTTQQTWQRATGERRATSPLLVLALATFAGVFVVGVIGGGLWLFLLRDRAPVPTAQLDAGASSAAPSTAAATSAAATATAAPGTATATSAPATAPPPAPQKPGGAKDAGAPSPAVADGGAAPPPAPPKKDEDLEAKRRQAENICTHHRFLLSQNDPKTNAQAKQVRDMVCLRASSISPNSGAANCDRANCRSACSMLQDQDCIRRLDFAERNAPLKY